MKLFDRPVSALLGLFVVTFVVMSCIGSPAIAADEEHGNPGQFIENIRKGLSGISKYFWSPKTSAPDRQVKTEPTDKKIDDLSASKDVADKKSIAANKSAAVAKALSKPLAKTKKPADQINTELRAIAKQVKKPAPGALQGETVKAKKNIVERHKAGERTGIIVQKTTKQPSKEVRERNAALAQKTIKKLENEAKIIIPREVIEYSQANRPQVQKKAGIVAAAKPLSPTKSAAVNQTPVLKKPVQTTKQARKTVKVPKTAVKQQALAKPAMGKPSVIEPAVKKQAKMRRPGIELKDKRAQNSSPKIANKATSSIAKKAARSTAPKASKKTVTKLALAGKKTSGQQVQSSKKGTYIWVPHNSSPLAARFGLTGITAHQLAANGDLNRTDGRWVFAPNTRGLPPGIYGLSDKIHAARNGGTWVGGGRTWLYVFDKKRQYSSFFAGTKSKQAVKTTKTATAEKARGGNSSPQGGKNARAAKPQASAALKTKPASKKSAEVLAARTAKRPLKRVQKLASSDGLGAGKVQAKTKVGKSSKMARSGNWSKVNGRWVFVPTNRSGKVASPALAGMAKQLENAPATGGWVRRDKRWVYVAPKNKRVRTGKLPASSAKSSPKSSAVNTVTKKSTVVKKAATKKVITGLAEGPDSSPKTVNKTDRRKLAATAKPDMKAKSKQKIWVRKNNRWVYTTAKTAKTSGTAVFGGVTKVKKPVVIAKRQMTRTAVTKNANMPAGKTAKREFYFFVPGQTKGTGSWFAAPLDVLKKARKLANPAVARR